jgi:membrane protease YdiL (CAAX protease family)
LPVAAGKQRKPGRTPKPAQVLDAAVATTISGEIVSADGTTASVPDRPRYGAGALIIAFLAAQLLSTIAYAIVQSSTSYDFTAPAGVGAAVGQAAGQVGTGQALAISVPPPLWITALMQLPLWLGLAVIPIWFATKRGRGVVADLGLRMKLRDAPIGLAIGVACQLVMVPALYWVVFKLIGVKDISAAARELTDRATDPLSIILVFLIVGIGAPIAEEIYFRGMAQRIFGRKLRPQWAILAAAAFFAASHLQPLQFPALLVFGIILGVLAWKSGRIGPSIWAHVGFNVVAAASLVFNLGLG